MLSRLSIAALWSPAGKGLTSWRSFVMINCVFVTFPCGILGQVWYSIVMIPDPCHLSDFYCFPTNYYVVGTQKNRLNETVLSSIQNNRLD